MQKQERTWAHALESEEKAFTIAAAVSLKHVKPCDIVLRQKKRKSSRVWGVKAIFNHKMPFSKNLTARANIRQIIKVT